MLPSGSSVASRQCSRDCACRRRPRRDPEHERRGHFPTPYLQPPLHRPDRPLSIATGVGCLKSQQQLAARARRVGLEPSSQLLRHRNEGIGATTTALGLRLRLRRRSNLADLPGRAQPRQERRDRRWRRRRHEGARRGAIRERDQGRLRRPHLGQQTDRIRASAAASMAASTMRRRSRASTISTRPARARSGFVTPGSATLGGAGVTTIGTKVRVRPGARLAVRGSALNVRRQVRSWEREMPCRRAVAETRRGPARLSSTMRVFSSSDQARRRPFSTISMRPKALCVGLSIRTALSRQPAHAQGGPRRRLTVRQHKRLHEGAGRHRPGMGDQIGFDEAGRRVTPIREGAHRDRSPDRRGRAAPTRPRTRPLALRVQGPIDRCRADGEERCADGGIEDEVAVPLHSRQQGRQKGLELFAADAVGGLPEHDQRFAHRLVVEPPLQTRGRLWFGRTGLKRAHSMPAVVARHGSEPIENARLLGPQATLVAPGHGGQQFLARRHNHLPHCRLHRHCAVGSRSCPR